MTERTFEEAKESLLEGATEYDIVHSGLEEVMTSATEEVIATSLAKKCDLRTAAYLNAINRIHEFYKVTGPSAN
jgi:glutamate dehydrogenase/leucine dehydrogenase